MRALSIIMFAALLAGCNASRNGPSGNPSDAFFSRLSALCGKAFSGHMVSSEAPDADMVGVPMIMHARECKTTELKIAFHVGKADGSWDRSRTWIVNRTADGLRLKHDHRHEDGSPDKVTMYGGETQSAGTAGRQEFVIDQESIALFRREGLDRSVTNVWAVEMTVDPGLDPAFAYELRRSGENRRFFRVEFDLKNPVDTPPPPWSP
jgi:hypothetical protein